MYIPQVGEYVTATQAPVTGFVSAVVPETVNEYALLFVVDDTGSRQCFVLNGDVLVAPAQPQHESVIYLEDDIICDEESDVFCVLEGGTTAELIYSPVERFGEGEVFTLNQLSSVRLLFRKEVHG